MPRHANAPESSRPPTVVELLERVAVERGLDFEPPPEVIVEALPALTQIVERLTDRCRDVQERRWLAAALAALSHHVQASTLRELPMGGVLNDMPRGVGEWPDQPGNEPRGVLPAIKRGAK
ncbi:hypothetical protein [Pseudonocardia nigra]|uniref:hypothetical protein n=1 Tax=Pseudonocardia nigra TaxID=1921578 RepID=UPI001C607B2D|nr:hypothetical protein [Pseudonocardia nigra]